MRPCDLDGDRPGLHSPGHPVGERGADRDVNGVAGLDRRAQRPRGGCLDADYAYVGPLARPQRDAREQAAAADWTDDRHRPADAPTDLDGEGALSGDDVSIVVRRDEQRALVGGERQRVRLGLVVAPAGADEMHVELRDTLELGGGSRLGNHHRGVTSQQPGRPRDAERVIAG